MNKLVTPNGGMPLYGDDLGWIQEAVMGALKGSGELFAFAAQHSGNCIITGCDISFSGGEATITEGFVLLDYEVCHCPPHTVAVDALAASSLKLNVTFDSAGNKVFADAVSRDTYAIRRAIISNGLNAGTEVVLSNPPRFYWKYQVADSILGGDWEVEKPVIITLRNNRAYWQGSVKGGVTNIDLVIGGALPARLVPSAQRSLTLPGLSGTVVGISAFPAALNGRVVIATDPQQDFAANELYLDGFSYAI
jgi:hypothetical protein